MTSKKIYFALKTSQLMKFSLIIMVDAQVAKF